MSSTSRGASPTTGRQTSRRRIAIFVTVTAAVLIAGAILSVFNWQRDTFANDRRTLVIAAGTDRGIEARLTGGFAYGSLRSPSRSLEPPGTDNLSLLATAGVLQKHVESDPSPTHLWAFGVAQLLLGRSDLAIRHLDDAVTLIGDNAQLSSDAAAARLARAQAPDGSLEDIARAIDAAERASTLDATLPEARFNQALVLEYARLTGAAIDAWTTYLSIDSTSGWAAEARTRVGKLRALSGDANPCLSMRTSAPDRIVDAAARCPQEAREYAEQLLGEWAAAVIEGQSAIAAETRRLVERLAAALAIRTGDRLLSDTVRAMNAGAMTTHLLAKGLNALEQGRVLYNADRRSDAAAKFGEARTLLRAGGSPQWLRAQQSLATVHTHRRELNEALVLLSEVERVATARHYLVILARTEWLTGVATLQRSDPPRALERYHRAARLFEQLGETANVSNVMNAAADSERILGDFARGWQSLSTALRHLDSVSDPTRQYLAYYNASLFARREGLERAALQYQRQALSVAKARTGPVGVLEASINYAGILGRLGQIAEAETSLKESAEMVPRLADAQPRAYMTARIAATRGEFLLERDPHQSVRELETAIQHFTTVEPSEIPRLLLLRGDAFERLGDEPRAAAAYLAGIDAFEARLGRVRDTRQRVSYTDEGWDLYRRRVAQLVKASLLDEALEIAERGRSRRSDDRETLPVLDRVRQGLDRDQVLVCYAALERELHAWVITQSSVRHRQLTVTASDLQSRAALISRLLAGRGSATVLDAALRALHDDVVAPLDIPASTREIVVLPDGPLRQVPFAALRDRDGRFLVQRAAVVVAESLSSLQPPGDTMSGSTTRAPRHALVVGEPVPDPARWPRLAPLPFAAREAAAVAGRYDNVLLLVQSKATKAHVLSQLSAVDLFHFAGHAVANEDFPELSTLVLTGTSQEDGALVTADLDRAHLKPGAIVVLSACQTGAGPIRRAAGIQSLAHAFLSKGAGSVIAASWAVEDFEASELMIEFHGYLSRGESPAQSLRLAQIAAIDAHKPVSSWAGFTVFGSKTTRNR